MFSLKNFILTKKKPVFTKTMFSPNFFFSKNHVFTKCSKKHVFPKKNVSSKTIISAGSMFSPNSMFTQKKVFTKKHIFTNNHVFPKNHDLIENHIFTKNQKCITLLGWPHTRVFINDFWSVSESFTTIWSPGAFELNLNTYNHQPLKLQW